MNDTAIVQFICSIALIGTVSCSIAYGGAAAYCINSTLQRYTNYWQALLGLYIIRGLSAIILSWAKCSNSPYQKALRCSGLRIHI